MKQYTTSSSPVVKVVRVKSLPLDVDSVYSPTRKLLIVATRTRGE